MKDRIGEEIKSIRRIKNIEDLKEVRKIYKKQGIIGAICAGASASLSVLFAHILDNRMADSVLNKGVFIQNDLLDVLLKLGVTVTFAGFGLIGAYTVSKFNFMQIADFQIEDLEKEEEITL